MFLNNMTRMIRTKYSILKRKVPYFINLKCNADFSLEEAVDKKELVGKQFRLNAKTPLINVILTLAAAVNLIAIFIWVKKAIFHFRYKRRFH